LCSKRFRVCQIVGSSPLRHNVNLAAFLPVDSADHIRSIVRHGDFLLARSWNELQGLIPQQRLDAVLVDPAADGSMKPGEVLALLRKYPSAPLVAYVPLSAGSLKAVFELSRHGLSRAMLHPARQEKVRRIIEIVSANALISAFLGAIEPSLGKLRPAVLQTIQELFERPHRFESGADLALHAGVAVRELYRDFCLALLGTPKKLVVIAKLLRGYSYLRHSKASVQRVATKLGYSDKRVFTAHVGAVFGCSPIELRTCGDIDGAAMQLLDWFYKPSFLSQRSARRTDSAARVEYFRTQRPSSWRLETGPQNRGDKCCSDARRCNEDQCQHDGVH